jgi:predicted  nucleic acid-binding Zn-ribbon protein
LLRGELPEEVSDLEDKIEGLKTRLAKFQAEVKDTEKAIAQRKLDIEAAQAAIEKYEEQRANVRNNREYDSLTKEIEFQDLEKQLANKRIGESNAFLVEKKAEVEKTKQEIEGREADLKLKQEELVSIIDETSKEEEQLLKERQALSETLDARMMVAYDKVRSNARNRLAVVTVKRDACGGCFNKIPPQRQLDIALSKKIIVCEYCGRILVSSEFEK